MNPNRVSTNESVEGTLNNECTALRIAFKNLVVVLLKECEHLLNKLKRRNRNDKCS